MKVTSGKMSVFWAGFFSPDFLGWRLLKKEGMKTFFFEVEISINNIITSSTRSTLASRFSNCIVVEGD